MTLRYCRDCGTEARNGEAGCRVCGSSDLVGRAAVHSDLALLEVPAAPARSIPSGHSGLGTVPAERAPSPEPGPEPAPEPDRGPIFAAFPPQVTEVEVEPEAIEPDYFIVSTSKLVVMTVATFGLYLIYWFAKQWEALSRRRSGRIRPVWRGILSPFFLYGLAKQVKSEAESRGLEPSWSPGSLTFAYVIGNLFGVLPLPVSFLVLVTVSIPVVIQSTMLEINDLQGGPEPGQYSGGNVVGIMFGGIVWFLVIAALLVMAKGGG